MFGSARLSSVQQGYLLWGKFSGHRCIKKIQGVDTAAADKPWSCILSKHIGPGNPYHHHYFLHLQIFEYSNWQKLNTPSLARLFEANWDKKCFLKIVIRGQVLLQFLFTVFFVCSVFSLSVHCFCFRHWVGLLDMHFLLGFRAKD